jgi:hypothetical protein
VEVAASRNDSKSLEPKKPGGVVFANFLDKHPPRTPGQQLLKSPQLPKIENRQAASFNPGNLWQPWQFWQLP